MFYTLLSWLAIGISAFLWGFTILQFLGKINHYQNKELDLFFMTGLCALTVYAQFFSLFRRVNRAAFCSVILANIIFAILFRKEFRKWFRESKKINRYKVSFVIFTGLLLLILASSGIAYYDTYLYHAQAIHWIEEYGVAPGLGNLHFRLAYNSSFLCLQALFSLKAFLGQSLHSMNGFIMWIMISYAVCSMKFWKKRKFFPSDFLRLIIILYCVGSIEVVSSPNTDSFVLALIAYIFTKWVSLVEKNEPQSAPYAYLCILCVYSVTLKLSASAMVFLVIMPAYKLIKRKKWGEILLYLGLGILVIAPFLARNVVLCGYLLYPYPELDLFSVDWKMASSSLIRDRDEIKAWAWGLNDVNRATAPFSEWFPVWKDNMGQRRYILFCLNVIAIPISLIVGAIQGIRKREWDFLHISGCMSMCFLFWFLSAPLLRYGEVFLFFLPLYLIGKRLEKVQNEVIVIVVMVILGTYYMSPLIKIDLDTKWGYPIKCADYDLRECSLVNIDNVQIYVPENGDQTGYYAFPSTPYRTILESIELRGESLSDGFRLLSK